MNSEQWKRYGSTHTNIPIPTIIDQASFRREYREYHITKSVGLALPITCVHPKRLGRYESEESYECRITNLSAYIYTYLSGNITEEDEVNGPWDNCNRPPRHQFNEYTNLQTSSLSIGA